MTVKSAIRVLNIFELLAQYSDGLTVKEISDKLSFPQSSTFNLVQTLYETGYLSESGSKKYKLGPHLIQLGAQALESFDFVNESQNYLQNLMKNVQETVFMAVLSEGKVVYVSKIDNNRSIRTSAQIGLQKPLYCTGLGKAFLAFMPREESKKILDKIELKPVTASTITDRFELDKQLSVFAEQGYALDNEENEEGLYCIAAPIFDAQTRLVAAVSVAGPKERMLSYKEATIKQLMSTTKDISKRMGFRG